MKQLPITVYHLAAVASPNAMPNFQVDRVRHAADGSIDQSHLHQSGVMYFTSAGFIRRLQQLEQQVQRVAEGDFKSKLTTRKRSKSV